MFRAHYPHRLKSSAHLPPSSSPSTMIARDCHSIFNNKSPRSRNLNYRRDVLPPIKILFRTNTHAVMASALITNNLTNSR